jgi:hypothetical protein
MFFIQNIDFRPPIFHPGTSHFRPQKFHPKHPIQAHKSVFSSKSLVGFSTMQILFCGRTILSFFFFFYFEGEFSKFRRKKNCARDSKDWVRIDPDFEEQDEYFSGGFSQIRRSKKFTQFRF